MALSVPLPGVMQIGVFGPSNYTDQTEGLLGVLNNDPSDDFLTVNGTVLASNISDSDIYHLFGEPCM